MRNVALLCLLGFTLSSCYVYQPYEQILQGQLTAVPLAKQAKEPELFFAGEKMPEKDYLRLGIVKEARTSYNSNLGSLLDRLKAKAQAMGADAIVVMGAGDTERVRTDWADDAYSVPSENMWGLAIRYLDNLQLEENVLSHLEITSKGPNAKSADGAIDLDPDGNLENQAMDKWEQYVYYHSLEYLLESKIDWEFYRVQVGTPDNLYDIVRQQSQNNVTRTRVRIDYDRNNRVTKLSITTLNQRPVNEKMVLVYDDQNRIIERRWTESGGKNIVVIRAYNTAGLISREDYTMQRGTTSAEPLLSVDYRYFTEEELLQLLEKEQIVRVEP